MRQYGIYSGKEYPVEPWNVAMARSHSLIIAPDDAEFEKSKRDGGGSMNCPNCGSDQIGVYSKRVLAHREITNYCQKCSHEWRYEKGAVA